jgi:acetate---CoA ligase (ADP-forming)
VDLAVAVCPAAQLQSVVETCPPGKAAYLLAISGGLGEVPGDGPQRQLRLVEAARARGIRLVGPNSVGLLNTETSLNASLLPAMPAPGPGASFVTQSGGFGITVLMYSMNHQLPVSKICDVGNTADVQLEEVLDHLAEDDDTTVVGLFVESIADPQRIRSALERLAATKPVVVTRRGQSSIGERVTRAHLGRSPGPAVDLAGTGVVQTSSLADLLNIAKARCWQPPLPGPRVAVVTGTGGVGSELAEMCLDAGLTVPELSADLQGDLAAVPGLPAYAPRNNPVDLTPIWWEYNTVYPAVIEQLLCSDEVDGALIAIQDIPTETPELAAEVARALKALDVAKPAVVFWGCKHTDLDNMRVLEAAGIPCYLTQAEAVHALAAGVGAS